MCVKSQLHRGLITASVGIVVTVAFALFHSFGVPAITDSIMKSFVTLRYDSFVWNLWQDPPYPIYTRFYVFNCTNYDKVVREGAIPIVEELGPYSFREYRFKNIIEPDFTDPNVDPYFVQTVDYREHRLYYFSKETSQGNELQDVITTVNPIYMTIAKFIVDLPNDASTNFIIRLLVNRLNQFFREKNETVFMTIPVAQLLFDGWPLDIYLELYRNLADWLGSNSNFTLPELPENLTSFSFGIYTNRNNTDDGLFRVATGLQDFREFGHILAWQNASGLPHWEGGQDSYCNMIEGTDGTIFPYNLDPSEKVFIYQTDLCRSVYVLFEKYDTSNGLYGRRFVLPRSVLANPQEDEANTCFCKEPNNIKTCYGTGLINLGACYSGAPLVGSSPHFYNADPRYLDTVIGLKPNKEDHETYLVLEERTNVLLEASKRVQLSIDMQNYRRQNNVGLSDTENLTESILPILWFQEDANIDEASASIFNIFIVIDIVLGILIGIGGILTIVGVSLIGVHYRKEKKRRLA